MNALDLGRHALCAALFSTKGKTVEIRGFQYALSSCAAAALLAGCGGSQPPVGAPGAPPRGVGRA